MPGRLGPPVPKVGSYVLYNTAVEADGDRVSLLYDLDQNVGVSYTIHPTPPEKRTGDWEARDTEGSMLDWPIRWLPGGMAWEDGGTAGGRVDAGVVRVTVSRGGKTIEVTPINGTFLTVAELPPGMDESYPTVRAYDADGNVVADNKAKDGPSCWVDPDGKVVGGVSLTSATPNSPGECEPARPWPPATK